MRKITTLESGMPTRRTAKRAFRIHAGATRELRHSLLGLPGRFVLGMRPRDVTWMSISPRMMVLANPYWC